MELSATTMTTATPQNNMANQQGTNNNLSISPTNNNNNVNNNINFRPPNGNDSLQSHMQKQPTSNVTSNIISTQQSIIQPSPSIDQKTDVTSIKIGNSPLNNGGLKCPIIENESYKTTTNQQVDEGMKMTSDESTSNIIDKEDTATNNITIQHDDKDINLILEKLLEYVEAELMHQVVTASSRSSSLYVNDNSFAEITSFVTPVLDEDEEDCKPKDIVTLRNLELTPPPQPPEESVPQTPADTSKSNAKKRKHSESAEPSKEATSEGRSKRQRKQTQLFQVGDTIDSARKATAVTTTTTTTKRSSFSSGSITPIPETANSVRKQQPRQKASTTKRKYKSESPFSPVPPALPQKTQTHNPPTLQQETTSQIPPDVIFYEKNDYLAIRNEENHFYLCQLTENVRVEKPFIKIRWLDTKDNGNTYFLTSHYDMVPQKSIIMPVILNDLKSKKKGQHLFMLDDQAKDSIMERLRRSINISSENEQ